MPAAQKLREQFLVDQMATIGGSLTLFCNTLNVRLIAENDANGTPQIVAIPVAVRGYRDERSVEVVDPTSFQPFPIEWSDDRGGYVIPDVEL